MNTKHKSTRTFCLLLFCLGCTTTSFSNQTKYETEAYKELSLKSDREALESLRATIPDDIKEINDTRSYVLSFFKERTRDPNVIRSAFQKDLIKKRNRTQDVLRKEREAFNASERKAKENFLKEQKQERDNFSARHSGDREKIKEFHKEQDAKRKDFFAAAKDRRKDFSSKQQEARKNLTAHFKDLRALFDEEMKLYRIEFKAADKAKKEQERLRRRATSGSPSSLKGDLDRFSPEVQKLILELDEMHKKPSENL